MNNLMIKEGLEGFENFNENVKKYYDFIKRYNYDTSDYYITVLEVEVDNMNSPLHILIDSMVCIPKEYKDIAVKVTCNFQCDNICLLDKDNNVICTTVGDGYDDICTPVFCMDTAFDIINAMYS